MFFKSYNIVKTFHASCLKFKPLSNLCMLYMPGCITLVHSNTMYNGIINGEYEER